MFDTIQGLPVHVLVLHASVVLVPLMALLTVAVAWRASWQPLAAWPVVAGNVLTTVVVFVTAQSGKALEARIGSSPAIARHGDMGNLMLYFMLGLLVASVLVALVRGRAGTGAVRAVGVLAVVAAVATTVWIVRTGHSGAVAVWRDVVTATNSR